MIRFPAILAVLSALVLQVALARLRYEDELGLDSQLLERIPATEDEDENSPKPPAPQELSIVGKPTKQSSTYLEEYSSDKAVDGSSSTSLSGGDKCSHTGKESHPWWRVDLGGIHCISRVDILNRGDCCSERLENAVVRAGTNSTPKDNRPCGSPVTAAQAAPRGATISFECDQPLRARYVSVDIPYTDKGFLQLCEVTVKELPLDQCPTPAPQELSIVGKPTKQSSTLRAYSSDKAVDGNSSASLVKGGKCSHTRKESHPWWRVDLGGIHCISSVDILNRGDCCSARLENAVVRAGTSSTPTSNSPCGSPVTTAQAAPLGGTISFECNQPLRARYISVDIPYINKGVLQLCEITVKELSLDQCPAPAPKELSIVGKPTEQSSTFSGYSSSEAVDGSSTTNLRGSNKCSHTDAESHPWWRVDLGGIHCISSVGILNRGDCCSYRLENATVRAGTKSTPTDNPQCGSPVTAAQAAPRGGTVSFECDQPLRARYVSVDIPYSDKGVLQLCEVTVEELSLDQCPAPASQELSIVGKPTEQSSTLWVYSSDKAADGNSSTNLYPGKKCSHTKEESHPWWRVDLGGIHCISSVDVLNRGDCCSERLENAVIRAGASSTPTDNPACGSPVTAAQAAPRGGTISFECDQPLRARYVSVDIPYFDKGVLQLCEVTVKEIPLDQCPE